MNKSIQLLALSAALLTAACQSNTQQSATTEEAVVETQSTTQQSIEVAKAKNAFLNPNLATAEELAGLGMLGKELAQMIIDERPFKSMTDLDTKLTAGIDSSKRAALYKTFFVPFNLNTTPEADFKLIPGVGNRMAHEFEEYRPYIKLEQFRKEMSKYVDDAEIARLEQFVFVPVELNTASENDILALPGVGHKMAHEFDEYRPYKNMEQFRREIGKYVDDKELARLERLVYIKE